VNQMHQNVNKRLVGYFTRKHQPYINGRPKLNGFLCRPAESRIFFKFQGITELITQKEEDIESEVLNMEEVNWKILSIIGEQYENIYL
jgi:hypothetical protein